MKEKFFNFIATAITDRSYTAIIVGLVFLYGWYQNGINGSHFDLNSILAAYGVVFGRDVLNHTVNSIFNSDRGNFPTRKEEGK